MAGKQVIRPRKELDPRPLYIGRMDLVIEGCSEDHPPAQGTAVAGLTRYQNEHGIIYTGGSQFCKGKVVWVEMAVSSTG